HSGPLRRSYRQLAGGAPPAHSAGANNPRMAQEIELKARVTDVAAVQAALGTLGGVRMTEAVLLDNFLLDDGDRSLQGRQEALRVRLVGERGAGGAYLTWKGPKRLDRGLKAREELEVGCDGGAGLMAILAKA